MSSPTGKRDVIRLRTFAEDVDRVRTEKGISEKLVSEALPKDNETVESKGVLRKIKKKSLDLREQRAKTEIDSDGVSFDEETATKVVEQSYEVSKSIADEAADKVSPLDLQTGQAAITNKNVVKSAADFLGMMPSETAHTTVAQPALAKEQTATTPFASKVTGLNATAYADISTVPTSVIGDRDDRVHELTDNEVGGGEIVSDKKRDRFKLLPAIGTAVSGWVGSTKDKIEEAQREKHTVEKTDQRIDTIKAAAQPRTLAPSADFSEVAQRLSQTPKNTSADAPVVVKPKQETVAKWSYTIPEPGAALEKTPTTTTPTPLTSVPIATTSPEPVVREIRNATFSLADLEQLTGAQTPNELPVQRGELAATAHQQIAKQEAVRQATQEAGGKKFTMPSLALPGMPSGREFLPSPGLAIIVVVVAIVAGIGTSLFFFWQPNEGSIVPAATTNPLFTAQLQADVFLDPSHATTMSTLLSAVSSTPGSLYLYLTRDGGQSVVPPTDVMNFLAPLAPGSFTRSVTNVSFGSLDNRPFIILRVNNFDSAFPGMLAWEQTMTSDLAPLFGPPVTESLDAQARTNTQTRGAFFKDIVASNLSSRVLVNERGEDRILYTFLDRQTIVITTDRLQLANILPLMR